MIEGFLFLLGCHMGTLHWLGDFNHFFSLLLLLSRFLFSSFFALDPLYYLLNLSGYQRRKKKRKVAEDVAVRASIYVYISLISCIELANDFFPE